MDYASPRRIGAQPHMLVINRHPPGKGNKEFLDWAHDLKGKPACFTPDKKTGKPHFMLGMQKEIDVK